MTWSRCSTDTANAFEAFVDEACDELDAPRKLTPRDGRAGVE
jgi:hypothetical protein